MAQTVRVARPEELGEAFATLGLEPAHAVLVVVGGAQTLDGGQLEAVQRLLEAVVVPFCDAVGAAVVDGGTDSGVMAAMGRARHAAGGRFPLVGVVAGGTVIDGELPDDGVRDGVAPDGRAQVADPARLEQHHTHFVVVPGAEWGDESPWIVEVARRIAAGSPVAGLLVGGGNIAARDVDNLVRAGVPVLTLAGTGGVADRLGADEVSGVESVDGLAREPDLAAALRRVLLDPNS
jgi:hypothetical protein